MQTQKIQSTHQTSLVSFQKAAISQDQLVLIKGGDDGTPPDDGYIGVEDIIGA